MNFYESHNLDSKALPIIFKERVEPFSTSTVRSSNWHENVEMIFVLDGDGEISNNGIVYQLRAGDIAVVNHNCLHSIYSGKFALRHRYLIVDRGFCIENGCDTEAVSFEPILRDDALFAMEERLHAVFSAPEDTPFRVLNIRCAVLDIVSRLCTEHATRREGVNKQASYIKAAIEFIRASFGKDISLSDVARFVGINESYLSREFRKYTGYTLVSYLNYVRCKEATKLLRETDLSIGEIAEHCGFGDKSYFSKTFKRYLGMLPCKFRRQDAGAVH